MAEFPSPAPFAAHADPSARLPTAYARRFVILLVSAALRTTALAPPPKIQQHLLFRLKGFFDFPARAHTHTLH